MARIWIVEDDDDIREIVIYALDGAGFETSGFEKGSRLFSHLSESDVLLPDVLLLDIMLPDDDGLAILKRLRQMPKFKDLPIIMLTAKTSEYDKVRGLDLGADDYIAKPFGVMELISRIKALLRRVKPQDIVAELSYQEIKINNESRDVFADGELVSLTFKEYELLHYLIINKGMVLSRDKILEKIWGYDFEGESRTLDMHINRLRQKLGSAGGHIKTVRNVGYKLGD